MPKSAQPDTIPPKNRPRRDEDRSEGGTTFVSLLFFWPFHLFRAVTSPLGSPLRPLLRFFGYPCVAGLYVLLVLGIVYGARASRYDLAKIHALPERSIVYDRNGEEIGRIHGEKRDVIPLSQVSETFRKAILAREDERFYQHGAVDPIGIVRAFTKNLAGKKEGASTLTQQLASDVFKLKQGESKNTVSQIDRKFLEIAIGIRIESTMSKDDILQAYLNSINWGRQIRGIEEASRVYFEKHASQLNLPESAMLAGIVRGPDAYNPFKSLESAKRERDTTLDRMVAAKVITQPEADAAKTEPIEIRPEWRRKFQESYAMDAIRHDLELILEKENIELGGLTISTTIDNRIQQRGEEALDKRLKDLERASGYGHVTRTAWQKKPEDKRDEPTYIQGAAVVIENHGGAVLAVVGGRDANESRFNRAQQAERQIGSIFKPFVYLAAFDRGLRPSTSISDDPISPGEIAGAPSNWHPKNSDGTYTGNHEAEYGLIRSRNTMSLRVGNYAGMERVKNVARTAGFGEKIPEKPTSYLGAWESTPWRVASAYTIFPNNGERFRPYLIREIRDQAGNVLYTTPQLAYPAAKPGSAWAVSKILREVATHGTAAAVRKLGFDKPCAGKTGTTNDFKDAWFAGYTSSLTCAVWVGFDTPVKTMQGGYGATLALPVWVEMMKTADRLGYKAGEFSPGSKSINARLCRQSGKRATAGCEAAGTAYDDHDVPADTFDPNDLCPIHPAKAIPVDEDVVPESATPRARPVAPPSSPGHPPRAVPVEEPNAPLRAEPVEE
ncbi:transglycosylase domain-containing protein [Luteolibacter sp. LG18]|uniref:transglycosylase domain-containing protein n=1 Tax=Luteolibacter sp. LG18 TaxID=2819286 RepID=UPI002B2DDEFF|nr:penicillin-binding protein [Luteolibacter sp. LG18]